MTLGVISSKSNPEEVFGKTGNGIYNDEVRRFLESNIQSWFSDDGNFSDMVNHEDFLNIFKTWIASSQSCKIEGLDSFDFATPSLGVTQALDAFHYQILREGRRLRVFRGEYPYARDTHPFDYDLGYLNDAPLKSGDAVILSLPFSGSGDPHPKMQQLFRDCERLEVPLFLDMAWFGTCTDIEVDLSHPAITHVAFSLTKGLTCGNYRSGVRFSRRLPDHPKDKLLLQHQWNHGIHLNLKIGRELMKKFGPDTQVEKYRSLQLAICNEWGLQASHCVHIANSHEDRFAGFQRDGFINRLNLREEIKRRLRLQRAGQ